jgi:hypothetical protein
VTAGCGVSAAVIDRPQTQDETYTPPRAIDTKEIP